MNESILVRHLTKRFGNKEILKGIDMDIPIGEFISILGPSGSGKTTFLRILAGILDADKGSLVFPPLIKQSPVLVFQDYQLFPYMSVYNNIAFGLQARRFSRQETESSVRAMAEKLGILTKLDAYPRQLSGGEKQRCALARALVLNPQVLLLDEPFANLDKNLKSETARLLRGIQQDFKLTLISVSHDQEEAMMLSDSIALLMEGQLKDFATAEKLYKNPRSLEAARFFGRVNCIPRILYNYFNLDTDDSLYCRPEDLDIKPDTMGDAIVEERFFNGNVFRYIVRLAECSFEIHSKEKKLSPGENVNIRLKDSFCLTDDSKQTELSGVN